MNINLLNTKGKKIGDFELAEGIFGQVPNENTIYEANKAYLANQRLGTAKAKTRGEVAGSGAKPWRQKGTGRARVGSKRTPVWRGGGVVFGPNPRDYRIDLSKKVKNGALISSLSQKAKEEKIIVLNSINITSIKTKNVAKILLKLGLKKPLFVLEDRSPEFILSSRNIPNLHSTEPENLCAYYVLSHKEIVFDQKAIENLQKRLFG
ncbi:MAG: 50S ribosomal protein L4 [bacterium]|nr:50S ribosomal protein L4 [bacterium]